MFFPQGGLSDDVFPCGTNNTAPEMKKTIDNLPCKEINGTKWYYVQSKEELDLLLKGATYRYNVIFPQYPDWVRTRIIENSICADTFLFWTYKDTKKELEENLKALSILDEIPS